MAGDLSLSQHTLDWEGDLKSVGEEIIFNGIDTYLQAADHANWLFAADCTIEPWVKFASAGLAVQQALIAQYTTATNNRAWNFQYRGQATPKGLGFLFSTDGTAASALDVDFTPTADQLYALCVERAGSTVRIYSDGVMLGSGTIAGAGFDSNQPMRIGARSDGIHFFNGRLVAVRITKGTARYASDGGYTVPALPLPTS